WRVAIRSARPRGLAAEVYSGRGFQEAVLAARGARGDFRIISGGLGFIRGDDEIPSYSLSLVPQSAEFIGAQVTEFFDVTRWWRDIQQSTTATPIAELLQNAPTHIAVIGISKAYLSLVANDLMALDDRDLDRLRIIGMGIHDGCPARLQQCLLPY